MTDSEFNRAIKRKPVPYIRVLALTILAVITLVLGAWDIVH